MTTCCQYHSTAQKHRLLTLYSTIVVAFMPFVVL